MVNIVIKGRENRSFTCDESDTVLRAALRNGIGFPYACNVGSCGNCRFQLLEGDVEHKWDNPPAWSERDLKRQRFLGCQARPSGDCTIKLRLNDTFVPANPPVRTTARIIDRVELTHDITEFRLQLDTPSEFIAGQYALLQMPGVEGQRAYSMSNLPDDPARWDFQIKKVPGGAATETLFDIMNDGDRIELDGPYGIAHFQPDAPRDIVLLAGGSGLSPMISIARAASRHPATQHRKLDFFFGGRTPRDICGEDILAELPAFKDTLLFHPAISNPDNDAEWDGHVGFLHDVAKQVLGDELKNREIYFAGPPLMARAIEALLFEMEIPPEQVHFDEFY